MEALVEPIKDAIFALFPIGSEWYDCKEDTVGTVAAHFRPRGIMFQWGDGHWTRIPFTALLSGRLVRPRQGGYFFEYRAQLKREDAEYAELTKGKQVWV